MAQYGEMSPAIVGQLADLSCKTVDSFAAEVALNPGDLVIRGTNAEKQVKLPASGTVKDAIGVVIQKAFTDEAVASGIEAPGVSCVFLTSSTGAGIAQIEIGGAVVGAAVAAASAKVGEAKVGEAQAQ